MSKKLRILSALLISLSIFVLLIGCAPKKAGKTSIRYTRWAGTQEAKDFQGMVDAFMVKYPNREVVTEFLPWDAYWEKLRATIMSGEAADVISLSSNNSAAYVTKGAFKPLDELAEASTLINEMQPGTKNAVEYNGKLYAMPIGVGVRALIYNKAMFAEAGIPYPNNTEPMTWPVFMKTMQKLTKKSGTEVVQYAAHFHKQEMIESLVNQKGGRLLDNNTHPAKILINSPEGIAGLQLMIDLINQELLPPHTGDWAGPWGTPDSAVATGKVAMMQAGPWGLGPLDDAKINYGAAPIPGDKKRANRGYINSLAIYRDSKKVDAAWAFIRWVAGVEGQQEFTKTGDLPANINALELIKKSQIRPPELMAAFYSELPYVITGPMLPSEELNTLLDDVITQMLQLKLSAAETAARIEKDGNEIIRGMFKE